MTLRMFSVVRLIVVAIALVAAAGVASADRTSATEHLVRGSKLYEQGRYDEAIAELKAGYAIEPRADFLYALGQAERKRGDCKAAIGWYQRYVDSGPSTQRTVATLVQIDRCKQELATAKPSASPPVAKAPVEKPPVDNAPVEAPPPPPADVTPAPASEPAVAASTRDSSPRATTPLYKRWWLWTLVAVVVAGGVGTGVALALTQRSTFDSTLPDLAWGQAALRVRF